MAKRWETTSIERDDEGFDLLDLPDNDSLEDEEPHYRIVVACVLLLTLAAFLLLRQYAKGR